jgi:hypothetical protein
VLNKVLKNKNPIFNEKKLFQKHKEAKDNSGMPSKVEQIMTEKESARTLSLISTQGTGMIKIQYIILTNVAGLLYVQF